MSDTQTYATRASRARHQDLSQAAVSRAVLASTVQKPYVLYPAAIGVLGVVAAVLLGPSALFIVPAAIGGAIGLGGWALDFFLRRNHHAAVYLHELQQGLSDRRTRAVANLREELGRIGSADGLAQLERLGDKYDAFKALLDKKLSPSEITYGRYLGMAEQVFLSILDNLQRVADTLVSVGAIDERHVQRRILALEQMSDPSQAQHQELQTLQARLALKRSQGEKLNAWLAQNERAMTRLDETLAAIAAMSTTRGHASTDIETAMRSLAELARRAPEYGIDDDRT